MRQVASRGLLSNVDSCNMAAEGHALKINADLEMALSAYESNLPKNNFRGTKEEILNKHDLLMSSPTKLSKELV